MPEKWVQTWGQAHSAFSFFYYPSCKKTYRMVVRSFIQGKAVRLELSNECAKNDVYIGGLTVANCDENGTFTGECRKITVDSNDSFCIKKGEVIRTDAVDIDVEADGYFCVSAYIEKGALRSGNLLDNVNLITVKGDVTREKTVTNQPRIRDSVREVASKVLGMYFHKPIPLFQSVELLNETGATAITVFGDSISQQGYWTNAFADRVRKEYKGRYSVINKSIMGNRIRFDYDKKFICRGLFGISGLNRLQRDVLNYPDTEYVILALGTNDFLQPGSTAPRKDFPTPEQAFDAVCSIDDRLKENGKKFIVFNVLNFGESADSRPYKTAGLQAYNKLLEENKDRFHAVYDQAVLCVNPDKPTCSKKEYLGRDGLHPNKAGGQVVADGADLGWFR